LIKTINEIKDLTTKAPIVEKSTEAQKIETSHYSKSMQSINQHDYFAKLERSLQTIKFCMNDMDITSVSLPLVGKNTPYYDDLNVFTTSEVPSEALTINVFDNELYSEGIKKFHELNKLKDALASDTLRFQDVLKDLMTSMSRSLQTISALKVTSTSKLIDESNKLLYKLLKAPYNHYSPVLEAEEIERIKNEDFNYDDSTQEYTPFNLKESSKVKYDVISNTWQAEDGSTTNYPFAVHQIQEEIIAPIVQNLMKENRKERLAIYNHIKDQKINYLNKWHQDIEKFYTHNRGESSDLINIMRSSLKEFVASYNTLASLQKTQESMLANDPTINSKLETDKDMLEVFGTQAKEFNDLQTDFENYMESLKEDIYKKSEEFERIIFYDAQLIDSSFKDSATAVAEVNSLNPRRKHLAEITPLFAKNANILPAPSKENIMTEDNSIDLISLAESSLKEIKNVINKKQQKDFVDNALDTTQVRNITVNNAETTESVNNTEHQNTEDKTSTDKQG